MGSIHKTASDISHREGDYAICPSVLLTSNIGVLTIPPPRFDSSIKLFTELMKMLYLHFPSYYGWYNSETATWKRYTEQSMRQEGIA